MSESGLIVSSSGNDVFSSTDIQKNFDSRSITHKIHLNGTASMQILSSGAVSTLNIQHGLPYAPFYQVWAEIPTLGLVSCPCIAGMYYRITGIGAPIIDVASDSVNLIIKTAFAEPTTTTITVNLRYIIFTDEM